MRTFTREQGILSIKLKTGFLPYSHGIAKHLRHVSEATDAISVIFLTLDISVINNNKEPKGPDHGDVDKNQLEEDQDEEAREQGTTNQVF